MQSFFHTFYASPPCIWRRKIFSGPSEPFVPFVASHQPLHLSADWLAKLPRDARAWVPYERLFSRSQVHREFTAGYEYLVHDSPLTDESRRQIARACSILPADSDYCLFSLTDLPHVRAEVTTKEGEFLSAQSYVLRVRSSDKLTRGDVKTMVRACRGYRLVPLAI